MNDVMSSKSLPMGHGNQFSDIGTPRWLSLSKPPPSLTLSCGRFDASMLRQAQQPQAQQPQAQRPLTKILSKKLSQNHK